MVSRIPSPLSLFCPPLFPICSTPFIPPIYIYILSSSLFSAWDHAVVPRHVSILGMPPLPASYGVYYF